MINGVLLLYACFPAMGATAVWVIGQRRPVVLTGRLRLGRRSWAFQLNTSRWVDCWVLASVLYTLLGCVMALYSSSRYGLLPAADGAQLLAALVLWGGGDQPPGRRAARWLGDKARAARARLLDHWPGPLPDGGPA